MSDEILIKGLRVATRIGVSGEERREMQTLVLDIRLVREAGLAGLGDAVENTTDYEVVAGKLRELCASGERRLIETLAEDVASHLFAEHAVAEVEIEVKKFILPDCDYVAVRIFRERGGPK